MKRSRVLCYAFGAVVGLAPLPGAAVASPGAGPAAVGAVASPDGLPRADTLITIHRGSQTVQVRPLKTALTPTGAEVVADRLVVAFKPTTNVQAFADVHQQASARGAGLARAVATPAPGVQLVDVSGAVSLEQAARAYRTDARVRYAEPDFVVHATTTTPNDPLFAQQYGMTKIKAPFAWDATKGSGTVKVAVLDCGIYDVTSAAFNAPGHPDINGKVVAHIDFTGSSTGADDFCDHGTMTAGIVAANTNNGIGVAGVGFNTSLMNGKVLDDNGSGTSTMVTNGIRWAADNGARVINMSLGNSLSTCPQIFQDAIDYAWGKGVVIVASAGNSSLPFAGSPANCNHVLAVGATDQNDQRPAFSNFGANVQVAAPGVGIVSTNFDGNYEAFDGTSESAPHVAGLAALVWATSFGTSNEAVVARIKSTADPIAGTGTLWVNGRINAAAAVGASGPPTTGLIQNFTVPQRIADSRSAGGPIGAGASRCFSVAGLNGIPLDAAAVVLNVTAVGYNTPGWLTVYPNGQAVPATSTLNFDTSEYALANGTIMRLGSSGQVCVNVGTVSSLPGSSHAILDATGYLSATALAQLPMLTSPQRLVDTRSAGGAIATGGSRCFSVAGVAGIPADVAAVVLNVTAVGYGTKGWLSAYPSGQPVPATSTLNFDTTEYAVANGSIMRTGTGGEVCVNVGTVNSAPGRSHVVLDVTGYLTTTGLAQLPMLTAPQRLVDTRSSGGPISSGTSRCFTTAGLMGIPPTATAVVLNVTAVGYSTQGWLTAYLNGQAVPATSTLNFDTSEYAMANGAIIAVGAGGQVCVNVGTINSAPGSSHVILDVVGYLNP
jgi:thermitase